MLKCYNFVRKKHDAHGVTGEYDKTTQEIKFFNVEWGKKGCLTGLKYKGCSWLTW